MSTTSAILRIRPLGSTREVQQSRSGAPLAVWWGKLSLWLARRWQRDSLRHRIDDERLLADIGVTREQALREAKRPFWS
jgi:uncharacterized protein YjiS (DUF1127 family)